MENSSSALQQLNSCWKRCMSLPLVRGQVISILIAGTGIFATLLSDCNPSANFPTFMNFLNYSILSVYIIKRVVRISDWKLVVMPLNEVHLANPLYIYAFAAVLDVEANFLVLTAYNYTSITSIMLLDCFTIPCAMLLSSYFLKARYQYMHIVGIAICLSGLACIVASDLGKEDGMSDAVVGDILCLGGAFLYACSNVIQEKIVKTKDREEYLGMIGLFGAGLAAVQSIATDLVPMIEAQWSLYVVLSISGFVICLNCMYINTSLFLQSGDATFFNLSLLTSDVYAVVFSYLLTGELVQWLYFIGFALVFWGLTIYHSSEKPVSTNLLCDAEDSIDGSVRTTSSVDDEYSPPSKSVPASIQHVSYNPLNDEFRATAAHFVINDDAPQDNEDIR